MAAQRDVERVQQTLDQLHHGRYHGTNPELRTLASERDKATRELQRARHASETATRRRDRSKALERLDTAGQSYKVADRHWLAAIEPVERQLQTELDTATLARDELTVQHQQRIQWFREHPEARHRLDHLDRSLQPTTAPPASLAQLQPRTPGPGIEPPGPDLGLGLGL